MKKFFFLLVFINTIYCLCSKDSVKTFTTNEIIVLANDKQIEKTTSLTELIIKNEHRNKYATLDNFLNEINGVRSIRNAKNEGYFLLRGFEQRQIGIFFDGIPIVNQFDGMVDLSQFSLFPVSKITVSKGLSSALDGANNLGGSINIITDNIFYKNEINAYINYGNIFQNLGAKIKQRFGPFYFFVAIDYSDFDNFKTSSRFNGDKVISNSYLNSYNGFVKTVNQIGKSFIHSLTITYGEGRKGIPVNREALAPRFWKMPEWRNIITNYATDFSLFDRVIIKTNIFLTQFRNIIDSYDDSTYSSQKSKFAFHSTQEYSKIGGAAIAEVNWENFERTKIAFSLINDKQYQQLNTNEPWKDYRSQLLSVSLEQNFAFGNFGGLLGLIYDKLIPTYADGAVLRAPEAFLNYQAGLNYSDKDLTIYSNYAHKSRFPTLKEFYSEVIGNNIPNPNLKSEFSDNFELGVKTNLIKNLTIRTSFYANYVKNLIDIVVFEDKTRQFINIGKVLFKGIEMDIDYTLFNFLIKVCINYQEAENKTPGAKSKILPLRPKYNTNLTISRNFDFGFNTQIQLLSYFNQFAYNYDKKEYFRLPNYNLLNVSLSYNLLNNLELNSTFMNVLDELYYYDWGYPQVGFNFNLGLKLCF